MLINNMKTYESIKFTVFLEDYGQIPNTHTVMLMYKSFLSIRVKNKSIKNNYSYNNYQQMHNIKGENYGYKYKKCRRRK